MPFAVRLLTLSLTITVITSERSRGCYIFILIWCYASPSPSKSLPGATVRLVRCCANEASAVANPVAPDHIRHSFDSMWIVIQKTCRHYTEVTIITEVINPPDSHFGDSEIRIIFHFSFLKKKLHFRPQFMVTWIFPHFFLYLYLHSL